MTNSSDQAGKVVSGRTTVWISGASRGIGAALAANVPLAGATIVNVSREPGAGSEHLAADLSDPASWALVEDDFVKRLKDLDGGRAIFFNNAGTLDPIGFAGEVDSPAYRANILVNSAAAQALGHSFLRALDVSGFAGDAHLIAVTSVAAANPIPGWSSYCASKSALNMWVRVVGEEQKLRGGCCRVIAVDPGVVDTSMQELMRSADQRNFPIVGMAHEWHDSGQLGDPTDVARAMWALVDRELDNGAVVGLHG